MEILAAPIQEYTDIAFRNAHASVIGGIDEYYTPFIRLEHGGLSRHAELDCTPGLSKAANTTPQVLVKSAAETTALLDMLANKGYRRVDFNFGCPFAKVVKSGYGAGMLSTPDAVREVLATAAAHSGGLWRVSVKMRLGVESADDWRDIVPVLNDVPLTRVVLHARTAEQQYEGTPDKDAFAAFKAACAHPVCYNGDVRSAADAAGMDAVMLGRGLLANPLLPLQLRGEALPDGLLAAFHSAYVAECRQVYQQPLQKLKVFWNMFLPNADKHLRKAVQKARTLDEYLAITAHLPEDDNRKI